MYPNDMFLSTFYLRRHTHCKIFVTICIIYNFVMMRLGDFIVSNAFQLTSMLINQTLSKKSRQ